MVLGRSSFVAVGERVFVLQPISLCAGEPSLSFMGVFCSSNSARLMSWLFMDAFLIRLFTVCTAFSALPFDCG